MTRRRRRLPYMPIVAGQAQLSIPCFSGNSLRKPVRTPDSHCNRAATAGWKFFDFFLRMAPITIPESICGVATCALLERIKWFDYGHQLPAEVRSILEGFDAEETLRRTDHDWANLPSVATPNGQAAFLFLLTSAIAPLVRLSYGKMVWMALPYTLVLGSVGFVAVMTTLKL